MATATASKLQELAACKAAIRRTAGAFKECGRLLEKARKDELWKFDKQKNGEPYKTFVHWTREEFGIGGKQAKNRITASIVADMNLTDEMFPTVSSTINFKQKHFPGMSIDELAEKTKGMTAQQVVDGAIEVQKVMFNQKQEDDEEYQHDSDVLVKHIRGAAKIFSKRKCVKGVALMEQAEALASQP